jgi:hypothetical protein
MTSMKVAIMLSVVVAAVGFARIVANYDNLAAEGYRWVTTDGPYACLSKDDLKRITADDTGQTGLQMVKERRAYYLVKGDIVKVVMEDRASGTSLIRAAITKDLWTSTRFLSKRPIQNVFGGIETPENWGLILTVTMQLYGFANIRSL